MLKLARRQARVLGILTDELADVGLGSELKVDHFAAGQKVDVTGTKGERFSGGVKRHNFRCRMPLMAIQYPTGRLDPLGNVKLPVKYGKVKRWRSNGLC